MKVGKVGIFTFNIISGGGVRSVFNLSVIMNDIFKKVYLFSTINKDEPFKSLESIEYWPINHYGGLKKKKLLRILSVIYSQIKMSYLVLKFKNLDKFFFIGEIMILPIIIAKILKKDIILSLPSSSSQISQNNQDFHKEVKFLANISFRLSNIILIYSSNLIKEWNLNQFKSKIVIIHEHYLDFKKFNRYVKIDERENIIGYIGRLSEEKGINNFLKAVEKLQVNYKIIIIGKGPCQKDIEKYIYDNKLINIELLEWISYEELPDYINKLKLIVIPSYTEGLPNILIESMACGTPVLANPVGSIPNIIKNEKTGFLMENNSPDCIEANIKKCLKRDDLGKISENAYIFVKKEFCYENVLEKWKKLFDKN